MNIASMPIFASLSKSSIVDKITKLVCA
jgi:hypothetical protein